MKRTLLGLALAMLAFGANAQGRIANTAAAAYVSPYAPVDPSKMSDAAMRVAASIDRGGMADMWDGASKAMQSRVKKKDFVERIGELRKKLGPVVGRSWIVVHREKGGAGTTLPAGQYASVEFELAAASGVKAKELVSFTLDADGVWRVVGYTLR